MRPFLLRPPQASSSRSPALPMSYPSCVIKMTCRMVSGASEAAPPASGRDDPFYAVGVLGSLTTPLADAGISIFAVSTFDTDYLLVKEKDLAAAVDVLRRRGHTVR